MTGEREIQVLVIDTDEIHDAFKIALIQSPLAGQVEVHARALP